MLRIKLFIFSLLCTGLFLTSCVDDETGGGGIGGNLNAPEVSLPGGLDVITEGAIIEPGATFRVQVDGLAIGEDMTAVTVSRDGANLSTDEFDIVETTDIDNNPQALFGDDATAFTFTYEITAPTEAGFYTYEFEVQDAALLTASASITIEVQGVTVEPSIVVESGTSVTAPAETLLRVNVTGTKGTLDLASISVWENGSTISDLSRIRYNDVDFDANPLPLFDPDTQGFVGTVTIRTGSGTNSYTIRITDTEGNNADFTFEVVEEVTATPLDNSFGFILFSNASGQNLGGLDLNAGVAVSSSSASADIRDLGIDLALPNATNWLQQVEPVNGTELKIVDLSSLPEGFSFSAVASKELVSAAFVGGATVTVTPMLQIGDLLAARDADGVEYLIQVETVSVTDNNNDDFYEFSIKY